MQTFRLALVAVISISVFFASTVFTNYLGTAIAQQAEQRADVQALSETIEALTVRLITSVRRSESPLLKSDSDTGKIVWTSLRNLNLSIEKLANGAALKDDSFHSSLQDSVRNVAAAATALESTNHKDKGVTIAKSKLIDAIGKLQENFSKAAVRMKEGGDLTENEKKKLEEIQAKHEDLKRKLAKVEEKVKNNKKALRGVRVVNGHINTIISSRPTLSDFLAVLIATEIIDGIIWGWHWWWGPWGFIYDEYTVGMTGLHDEIMLGVAFDWADYEDLAVDVSDIDMAADFDDAEMEEASVAMDEQTPDFPVGLSPAALEGIEDVNDVDLQDPDFGSYSDFEPETMEQDLSTELETLDVELQNSEELEMSEQVSTPEFEPEPIQESMFEAEPMPLDDIGGTDFGTSDLGGDMGVLDGGFDFD